MEALCILALGVFTFDKNYVFLLLCVGVGVSGCAISGKYLFIPFLLDLESGVNLCQCNEKRLRTRHNALEKRTILVWWLIFAHAYTMATHLIVSFHT